MPLAPRTMIILNEQRTPETTAFASLLALSTVFSVAMTAVQVYLAATIKDGTSTLFAICVAAAVLDCIILIVLCATLVLRFLSYERRPMHIWLCHTAGCVSMITADAVTILALARTRLLDSHSPPHHHSGLTTAGIVVWALAVLFQLALYGSIVTSLYLSGRVKQAPLPHEMTPPQLHAIKGPTRTLSLHLTVVATGDQVSSSARPPTLSPVLCSPPGSPLTSPRQVIKQVLRPISSKTKLLTRSPSIPEDNDNGSSRPSSFSTVRETDGFESWDYKTTSFDDADTTRRVRHPRTRLETIPGSQPASPAKALDGPFPEKDQQLFGSPPPAFRLEAALKSPSVISVCSDTSSFLGGNNHGAGSFMASRRPSVSQSNIHPLFRSESPVPPPVASPGTTIVASPFAGQVISHEIALGSRRHPSAPSSRPGSARGVTASPSLPDLASFATYSRRAEDNAKM